MNLIIPKEENETVLAIISDQTLLNSLRKQGISVLSGCAQISQFCPVYSLIFLVQVILVSK